MALRNRGDELFTQFKKEITVAKLRGPKGELIERIKWRGKIYATGSTREVFQSVRSLIKADKEA